MRGAKNSKKAKAFDLVADRSAPAGGLASQNVTQVQSLRGRRRRHCGFQHPATFHEFVEDLAKLRAIVLIGAVSLRRRRL
jgi:hypothetical protein